MQRNPTNFLSDFSNL